MTPTRFSSLLAGLLDHLAARDGSAGRVVGESVSGGG